MVKIIEGKVLPKEGMYNKYNYDKGKKTEKTDTGLRYLYLDKYGLLHCTYWENIAAQYDKYAVTNEVKEKEGFPLVYGTVYTIWGAGETYVNLSHDSNEKFHTKPEFKNGAKKITVPHNTYKKMRDCEILREIYMMLK